MSQKSDSAALFLYYAAFAIYICTYVFKYTTFEFGRVLSLLEWAALVLLFPKLVTQNYTAKQLFLAVAIALCGVASWRVTHDKNIMLLFLFVIAGQGINVKTLAKIVLIEEAVIFVITVSCCSMGLIDASEGTRVTDTSTIDRTSLGYSSPNRFGAAFVAMCCAYAVIKFPRFDWWDLIIYIVPVIVIEGVANSRASEVTIVFIALFSLICSLIHGTRFQRPVLAVLCVMFVAIAVFSLVVMVTYEDAPQWLYDLDDTLSGRLNLSHEYYLLYPIKLLGNAFNSRVVIGQYTESFVIDNAYAKVVIVYGIVPATIVLFSYLGLFTKAFKRNCLSACVFGAFVYACYGFAEWQLLHFAMNYCLVACATLLYPEFTESVFPAADSYSEQSVEEEAAAGKEKASKGSRHVFPRAAWGTVRHSGSGLQAR